MCYLVLDGIPVTSAAAYILSMQKRSAKNVSCDHNFDNLFQLKSYEVTAFVAKEDRMRRFSYMF